MSPRTTGLANNPPSFAPIGSPPPSSASELLEVLLRVADGVFVRVALSEQTVVVFSGGIGLRNRGRNRRWLDGCRMLLLCYGRDLLSIHWLRRRRLR